jgi:tetratricopeptide (TPR) repeat protein
MDPDTDIAEAVRLHREGRLGEAASRYEDILRAHPDHPGVLHNLGVVAAQGGDHAAALGYFDRALAARPDYASAHHNKAGALWELGRLEEAADGYRLALDAEPGRYDAWFRLGLAENALGRRQSALACFARTSEIRRAAATAPSISKHKLDHDIAQYRFLAASGIDSDRISRLADDYAALENDIDWPDDDGEPVALTDEQSARIAATHNRPVHVADAPETVGSSLSASLDTAAIARDFRAGFARVDGLLAPEVVRALRRFLLESTIWFDFSHVRGFLAAYLEDGLACPLIFQIASDLRRVFPEIFGPHALSQAWAFKCVGGRHSVDIHMDSAAVSINFWITPNDANLDREHGGLVFYHAPPPPDWRIAGYNQDIDAIREFLAQSGSPATIIPYGENRAVIFDSNLFHESDAVRFRPGYENHRINVTMLFGYGEG